MRVAGRSMMIAGALVSVIALVALNYTAGETLWGLTTRPPAIVTVVALAAIALAAAGFFSDAVILTALAAGCCFWLFGQFFPVVKLAYSGLGPGFWVPAVASLVASVGGLLALLDYRAAPRAARAGAGFGPGGRGQPALGQQFGGGPGQPWAPQPPPQWGGQPAQQQQQQAEEEARRRQQQQAEEEARRRQQQQAEEEARRRQQEQAEAERQRQQQQAATAHQQQQQQQGAAQQAPAGWYPDPSQPGRQRYWTGSAWTNDVR